MVDSATAAPFKVRVSHFNELFDLRPRIAHSSGHCAKIQFAQIPSRKPGTLIVSNNGYIAPDLKVVDRVDVVLAALEDRHDIQILEILA